MYFKFTCQHCGKSLKAREEDVGRKGKCPYCHTSFTVPQPTAGEEAPAKEEEALFDALQQMKEKPEEGEGEGERPLRPAAMAASEGTNINPLHSSILGLIFTIGFYVVLVLPFYKFYFGELFLKRGWVPFAEVFLMCWAFAILVLKYRKIARQKEALLFDVLPNELGEDITPQNVERFIDHVRSLPARPGESFLITRVLRALEHFSIRKSNPEVANLLSSQSDIDAAAVESSYTLLKVFIWAIPILGFIGTVIGISLAVGSFSGALERAQDLAVLKQSLGNVTSGLSTAFDTTLIALVMSILIMFPTSAMQKTEEDVLNSIDEYCNENLLKRLKDEQEADRKEAEPAAAPSDLRELIRQTVASALAAYQAELEAWAKKLEAIGSTITEQVAEGWQKLFQQTQRQHEERLDQLTHTLADNSDKQNAIIERIEALQEQITNLQRTELDALAKATEATRSQAQAVQATLRRTSEELRKALVELVRETKDLQAQMAGAVQASAQSLGSYFSNLEQGLTGLNSVLERLNQNPQLLARTEPARSGWWPFRRKAGNDANS